MRIFRFLLGSRLQLCGQYGFVEWSDGGKVQCEREKKEVEGNLGTLNGGIQIGIFGNGHHAGTSGKGLFLDGRTGHTTDRSPQRHEADGSMSVSQSRGTRSALCAHAPQFRSDRPWQEGSFVGTAKRRRTLRMHGCRVAAHRSVRKKSRKPGSTRDLTVTRLRSTPAVALKGGHRMGRMWW